VIFASFNTSDARLSHGAENAKVADQQVTAHIAHLIIDLVIGISSSNEVSAALCQFR
jgi:hypothetical protein